MKAYTKYKYGGPEVLKLEEIEKPDLKDNHILVKIAANSVNPADWHILRGKPYLSRLMFGLFKPKDRTLGADFSGIVEAVGSKVSDFKKGDRVFGESLKHGVFSEFALVDANASAIMPEEAEFHQMACLPIAGLTALQALLTHGNIKPGESVLINGSSGGVGHLAIQIAKVYGAKVTGVCSGKNVEFVKSLGADQVIAYDQEDIHKHSGKYDLIIDTHGNLTHSDYTRMGNRGVIIGFTTVGHMIPLLLRNVFSRFSLKPFTAEANTKDLETLATLIESKKINVHIDKSYSYDQLPEAITYIEAMRTRGKVAIIWD